MTSNLNYRRDIDSHAANTQPPPFFGWVADVARVCVLVAFFILTTLSAIDMSAQTHRTTVYFHVGKADIDTALFGNSASLDSLRHVAAEIAADSTMAIAAIHYEGYASPEGPEALNRRLSRQRCRALENYVRGYFPGLDSVSTCGVAVYDSTVATAYARATAAGRRRMVRDFGHLRCASVTVDCRPVSAGSCDTVVEMPSPDTACVAGADTVGAEEIVTEVYAEYISVDTMPVRGGKPLYIGLRTNMLYDAALIPTLGADVYVGRKLSISGQWSYAWWSHDVRHRYWRYYGGDLGVRLWFGRQAKAKPLTGHHIGIYGQLFTYDFETGGKGQMGAKFNYGGGIEYGFSLPVGRRLNIDFSLGAGFITGRYHKYTPVDGHYVWQSTHNRRWFGPTKAEVSLVWLIGRGNFNARKGGAE